MKFQYAKVERGGSACKYGNAIDWLIDAGLIGEVRNVSLPEVPLAAYEKPEEFKAYVSDIGLLTYMFGFETQSALVKGELVGPAKGGIYENLIYDIISKRGVELRYYRREGNDQEIEFLVERGGSVIPVEVKSSRGGTISPNEFIE